MSRPIPEAIRSERLKQLHTYMSKHQLKSTRQRDLIVQLFFETTEHISAEELYVQVKKKDAHVGFATVYRTLKMLADSGLANRRNFGDGHVRYENTYEGEHHDHMVCTVCGSISEFESEALNAMQKEMAQRRGFKILYHKTEFYGVCRECNKARKA